ncbi:MAG: hypothetical protein P8M11_05255 [Planctomycetota bacterium]|nr:hypothetical protein [Planctomycetota bacterium]MDG1983953.1 hypothetical protein [Planctomycetota bacterium]
MTLISTLALATALSGGGGGFSSLTINEIRIDQPSADNDEFFELAGPPGTNLTGLYYVVIGDGAGGSGTVESVTDLAGSVIPASGYFVCAESSFSLGTADLVASLNFENNDNVTHVLIGGTIPSSGDDLDTDDDGLLDDFIGFAGGGPFIVDLVSLIKTPYTGDFYYAGNLLDTGGPLNGIIGPNGNFAPAHVFKCTAGWQIGEFGTGSTDSPGAANSAFCPVPRINEIRIDQPSSDDDEFFELLTEPGASLDGLSYIVIGDGSGGSGVVESITDLTGNSTSGSGYFLCAESSFNGGTPDLTATLGFENGDNVTHLLVRDFTGVLQEDLDTDDDGVLDITPWSEILDAISLIDEIGGGDQSYGASLGFADLGPNGNFVPAHAVRCEESWRIGTFELGFDTWGVLNEPCRKITYRCGATEDPINKGIPAFQGSGSLSLNDTSAVIYNLPVDSFGVLIAGYPQGFESTPFGWNCLGSSGVRIAYGFATDGVMTIPLDIPALSYSLLDELAVQYLYRDSTAPLGARFSDATLLIVQL